MFIYLLAHDGRRQRNWLFGYLYIQFWPTQVASVVVAVRRKPGLRNLVFSHEHLESSRTLATPARHRRVHHPKHTPLLLAARSIVVVVVVIH